MRHEPTLAPAKSSDRELRSRASDFLLAERVGDSPASDAALRGLFRALPSPMPSVDFAWRVLDGATLGTVRPAVRLVRDLEPRHRWLVAAATIAAAVGLAYLLPLAVLLLAQVKWGALLASVGAAFGHMVSWLHALAPFGRAALSLVVALGHAFWFVLSSPQVLLTLVLATSVVGLCVRLLTELIHSSQDPAHASL